MISDREKQLFRLGRFTRDRAFNGFLCLCNALLMIIQGWNWFGIVAVVLCGAGYVYFTNQVEKLEQSTKVTVKEMQAATIDSDA